jgi:hypothetical protein
MRFVRYMYMYKDKYLDVHIQGLSLDFFKGYFQGFL